MIEESQINRISLINSEPWYKEGLRFKCTGCGKCCSGAPGYVWISIEEIVEMAKFLNISHELFSRRYIRRRNNQFALIEKKGFSGESECVFLDGKKCQVYQARPAQCRTYPWWKENLNSEESWKLAAQECEGISIEAPLVSFSEIQQSLNKEAGDLQGF